jgi:hypothetical protein
MMNRTPGERGPVGQDGRPTGGGTGAHLIRTLLTTALFAVAFFLAFYFLRVG